MEHQNARFKELIQKAQVLLNMPAQEFEDKYSELIRLIGKGTPLSTIEIRLNEENITVSCLINKLKQCIDVYFFFDRMEDEDAFINYLVDYFDYSFKKRAWFLSGCIIKTKEIEDIITFHFYRDLYSGQV